MDAVLEEFRELIESPWSADGWGSASVSKFEVYNAVAKLLESIGQLKAAGQVRLWASAWNR